MIPDIEYNRENLWCMSTGIADLLERMFTDFRKNTAGYPANLTEDKWDKILKNIAKGFAAVRPLMDDYTLTEKQRIKLFKRFDRGMKLFHKYYFDFWS